MNNNKEKPINPYTNVDTWKIMFDFYMYMKNRDWVEIVEEDREREKLQQKNNNYQLISKHKTNNYEKTFKISKRHPCQTPNESYNKNNKRDMSNKSLRKECKTVKCRPINERRKYICQRPEFKRKFAEIANKNNDKF